MLRMQDSRTPLHWAASAGHVDVVTYLLENGADVDKVDDSGWSALHVAGWCDWPLWLSRKISGFQSVLAKRR